MTAPIILFCVPIAFVDTIYSSLAHVQVEYRSFTNESRRTEQSLRQNVATLSSTLQHLLSVLRGNPDIAPLLPTVRPSLLRPLLKCVWTTHRAQMPNLLETRTLSRYGADCIRSPVHIMAWATFHKSVRTCTVFLALSPACSSLDLFGAASMPRDVEPWARAVQKETSKPFVCVCVRVCVRVGVCVCVCVCVCVLVLVYIYVCVEMLACIILFVLARASFFLLTSKGRLNARRALSRSRSRRLERASVRS
jgi:hypothetical protein